jgi:hypothetical protein
MWACHEQKTFVGPRESCRSLLSIDRMRSRGVDLIPGRESRSLAVQTTAKPQADLSRRLTAIGKAAAVTISSARAVASPSWPDFRSRRCRPCFCCLCSEGDLGCRRYQSLEESLAIPCSDQKERCVARYDGRCRIPGLNTYRYSGGAEAFPTQGSGQGSWRSSGGCMTI